MGQIAALQRMLHTEIYVHVSVGRANSKGMWIIQKRYAYFDFKIGRNIRLYSSIVIYSVNNTTYIGNQ